MKITTLDQSGPAAPEIDKPFSTGVLARVIEIEGPEAARAMHRAMSEAGRGHRFDHLESWARFITTLNQRWIKP